MRDREDLAKGVALVQPTGAGHAILLEPSPLALHFTMNDLEDFQLAMSDYANEQDFHTAFQIVLSDDRLRATLLSPTTLARNAFGRLLRASRGMRFRGYTLRIASARHATDNRPTDEEMFGR